MKLSLKRFFEKALQSALSFLLNNVDFLVQSFARPPKEHNDKKSLLIVRLDAIGDFVIFLDSFKEYRKLYPPDLWEITVLGNDAWADLAKNLSYADRFIFINVKKFYRNPIYRFLTLKNIKQTGFDTVIQPTYYRSYFSGDAVVRASSAQVKIGSIGGLDNITQGQKLRSDCWYTRLISATNKPLTELERNAEFLRGLGLKDFKASLPVYPIETLSTLQEQFAIDRPYFVLFPGAGDLRRRWAEERFAEIAKLIHEKTKWLPLLSAGPGEEQIARKVISSSPDLPWLNFAGKITLDQLLLVLKASKILISNETSAIQLAASVRCPSVCILGGGHFGRFSPYINVDSQRAVYKKMDCFQCNWECIYPTIRCIEEITVDAVWKEVKLLLEKMKLR